MDKIRGVNLGNWLVLEKWMQPELFEESGEEDETWLNRKSDPVMLAEKITAHRDTYVTENDFENIAKHGLNMVRIPIPYFLFGDRPPFAGCVSYIDNAFDWAEKNGLQILLDLHTTPGSQNGYDNGGICGVCKWCRQPDEVKFVLNVLERVAQRYGERKGLYGIEVVNEPISFPVWMTSPTRKKAKDKEEAKGSGYVPMKFLKTFYMEAYNKLRNILPEEKVICFHDGFRLMGWQRFFKKHKMKNVILDTHIYIFAMENFFPIHEKWVYDCYVSFNKWKIKKVSRYIPVVVGEWCICNKLAEKTKKKIALVTELEEKRKEIYQQVAELQLSAWSVSKGYFYWNYQLYRDMTEDIPEVWKNSWDLRRCWEKGWMPEQMR